MTHTLFPGKPFPFGAHFFADVCNFTLYAPHATRCQLHLFDGKKHSEGHIELDPTIHRTGDVWHVGVKSHKSVFYYQWHIENRGSDHLVSLLDPFGVHLDSPKKFPTSRQDYLPMNYAKKNLKPFDWQQVCSPHIPKEKLVIYEMHTRAFTKKAPDVKHPGTFEALIEQLPYLKRLGINAIELLPIYEFCEGEYDKRSCSSAKPLCNFWGYSTLSFFTPMNRYGVYDTEHELKELVKQCHQLHIEVILDVVYNHTAEGNEKGPTYHFKGIDPKLFYLQNSFGDYLNYSGCGNTVNSHAPFVQEWILQSLRHFVSEYHIDGFRFDLAATFYRDSQGHPIDHPPILDRLRDDPILKHTKLFVESWDAAGLYKVGHFAPDTPRFIEWNGPYRDSIRKFIIGSPFEKGTFATRFCGSKDLYASRSPLNSVNFITCHDGFSLLDLFSYNHKHNLANLEGNRDGENRNHSTNFGAEGPTTDPTIIEMRQRAQKNALVSLLLSQGIPMLCSGDEVSHTKQGNNNTWCQDNDLNYFPWENLNTDKDFTHWIQSLIAFRHAHAQFESTHHIDDQTITWYGPSNCAPAWDRDDRFLALVMRSTTDDSLVYIAWNMSTHPVKTQIPESQHTWYVFCDTYANYISDNIRSPQKVVTTPRFLLPPYTTIVTHTLATSISD